MADASKIDRTIVGWRAWYTGGRTYDSDTTRWQDLPAEGALCFRLYYRTRPLSRVMQGTTLFWRDGEVYGCDSVESAGLSQELWDRRLVKRGRWVDDAEWAEVYNQCLKSLEAPNEEQRIDRG